VVENRAQGVFAQPNDFGTFTRVILLLAIGMSLAARTRTARLAAALALSLSRGFLIGKQTDFA
jgi:hypothetical protein